MALPHLPTVALSAFPLQSLPLPSSSDSIFILFLALLAFPLPPPPLQSRGRCGERIAGGLRDLDAECYDSGK